MFPLQVFWYGSCSLVAKHHIQHSTILKFSTKCSAATDWSAHQHAHLTCTPSCRTHGRRLVQNTHSSFSTILHCIYNNIVPVSVYMIKKMWFAGCLVDSASLQESVLFTEWPCRRPVYYHQQHIPTVTH